jgi:predicted HTH domain antitoxin
MRKKMSESLSSQERKLKMYFDSLEDEEKIVLFSIGALDNTPIRSKTKLQKLLFLVSNVFEDYKELLVFEPHLFGPYSENLDTILEDLIKMELVIKKGNSFKLSEMGYELYNRLKPKAELISVIEDFKDFLNDLSEDEILTFVYVSYPKYTSEAIKWNELKEKRIQYSISLLEKHKVSFGKAAEIAGLNTIEFGKLLKNRGIKWRL